MALKEYVRKRDFSRTKEPKGRPLLRQSGVSNFVIQKHAASRLHYDFRLEMGGTLKSWAVPKGIPFAKGERHLAVEVEDHPVEYATFEGIIPKGQYGGGTVMLWDRGTYEPLSDNPLKDLKAGKLHVLLLGSKLNGEWALVRMGKESNQWLLIKAGENMRPLSKKKDDQSAASGRTMAQIASQADAQWTSDRDTDTKLRFIEPMKAVLVDEAPGGKEWVFEVKFDGYRALAVKDKRRVELFSRNAKSLTAKFPEVAEAVAALSPAKAIFDGEIVALDEKGRPSFQLLQDIGNTDTTVVYYVFDLLEQGSQNLCKRPLIERKAALQKLLTDVEDPIRFSANLNGKPKDLVAKCRALGLEGIIAKNVSSTYEPGRRSGAWLKIKVVNEQEFVIGGFTPPQGSRQHLGALLAGYYEGGELKFAGKAGTGFNARSIKALYDRLKPLARDSTPFANLPEKQGGRWSKNLTPAEMKKCRWVEPQLVCQLKFAEWTRDGKLRQPVFLGLREDKDATEVVREKEKHLARRK
ncbi:MAG: non-homologous end-joining DNA ligase [Verrucomicrobiales bacterium]